HPPRTRSKCPLVSIHNARRTERSLSPIVNSEGGRLLRSALVADSRIKPFHSCRNAGEWFGGISLAIAYPVWLVSSVAVALRRQAHRSFQYWRRHLTRPHQLLPLLQRSLLRLDSVDEGV